LGNSRKRGRFRKGWGARTTLLQRVTQKTKPKKCRKRRTEQQRPEDSPSTGNRGTPPYTEGERARVGPRCRPLVILRRGSRGTATKKQKSGRRTGLQRGGERGASTLREASAKGVCLSVMMPKNPHERDKKKQLLGARRPGPTPPIAPTCQGGGDDWQNEP